MVVTHAVHMELWTPTGRELWKYTGERFYAIVGDADRVVGRIELSSGEVLTGTQFEMHNGDKGYRYISDDGKVFCAVLDRQFDEERKLSLDEETVLGYSPAISPDRLAKLMIESGI